jgi:hypothetical protein
MSSPEVSVALVPSPGIVRRGARWLEEGYLLN